MRIAFNAIPVRPGGGLTVMLGLFEGLRCIRPDSELIAYCSANDTAETIRSCQAVDQVISVLPDANNGRCFLWQNYRLGQVLADRKVDVLVTFNHFLHNVRCKQVVYHLNVRRFSKEYRERRLASIIREGLRDRAARNALRRADANVFESNFLRVMAEASIDGKANAGEVIYIGLPNELTDASLNSNEGQKVSPRIAAVTSPHPHKDNETMIRTVAELVHDCPDVDWHLDVAGGRDAAVWDPFQRLADELGVGKQITWHGFCSHQQLDSILRGACCLLSTSAMESFAMVPLEAMARGCPPIAANTSSMPESVGRAGVLVPPHDPAAFAAAIIELYRDPILRQKYIQAGYQHIQKFRWSECGQQFDQLFDRICA